MKTRMRVMVLSAALLLAGPLAAQDGPSSWITGNVMLTTDYSLRGISQTLVEPALQGGFDLVHPSGFHVGAWASSVNFGEANLDLMGPRAQMEFDAYGGYTLALGSAATLDAGAIYYAYPGAAEGRNYNYYELTGTGSATAGPLGLTAGAKWSPEFFAGSGSALYVNGVVKLPIQWFTLMGGVGKQTIELNDVFGVPDYLDWMAGGSATWSAITATLQIVGTDMEESACFGGTEYCKTRAVVSLSRAL
jgi:uncharacterized protein (TIGR02001 family)